MLAQTAERKPVDLSGGHREGTEGFPGPWREQANLCVSPQPVDAVAVLAVLDVLAVLEVLEVSLADGPRADERGARPRKNCLDGKEKPDAGSRHSMST